MASGTLWPSPSKTFPWISTRSPETPGPVRSLAYSRLRPISKNGPTVCDVEAWSVTLFFPRRFLPATEDDVEFEAQRLFRQRRFPIKRRDEPVAGLFIGGAVEDGIERQQRVAWKIHLGHQPSGKGRTEKRKMNVRRPPGV